MASDFLKNMARQQAEKIDQEHGADAYGGSRWRAEHTSSASGPSLAAAQQTHRILTVKFFLPAKKSWQWVSICRYM